MGKKLICAALALAAAAALSSCGKKNFKVTEDLTMTYSGFNGYGTADLDKDDWYADIVEEYGEDMDFMEQLELAANLDNAVQFSVEPSENLSNGDKITVTVEVNNDKLKEYKFKLTGGTETFTVAGLEDVEEFDPFENVTVTFEGVAPNATARVTAENNTGIISLNYKLDKNTGLSNGDQVVVTASPYSGSDLETYCMGLGKKPTASEKTYTVEGLACYASQISDIPDDMLEKMDAQAQDKLKAYCASNWSEESKLTGTELLGYYFLTPKEGASVYDQNYLYLVYAVKANIGKNSHDVTVGDVTYYYFTRFDDIMLLEDGTCSVNLAECETPGNTYKVEYTYQFFGPTTGYYSFKGYGDLDSMFNDCVTTKIDQYTYENTVK